MLWTHFSWAVSLSVMLFSSCLIWLIRSVALGAGNCPWEQRQLSLLSSESVIRFTVNKSPQRKCWLQPPPLLSPHRNSCLKCTKPDPPPHPFLVIDLYLYLLLYSLFKLFQPLPVSVTQKFTVTQTTKSQPHNLYHYYYSTTTSSVHYIYLIFITSSSVHCIISFGRGSNSWYTPGPPPLLLNLAKFLKMFAMQPLVQVWLAPSPPPPPLYTL